VFYRCKYGHEQNGVTKRVYSFDFSLMSTQVGLPSFQLLHSRDVLRTIGCYDGKIDLFSFGYADCIHIRVWREVMYCCVGLVVCLALAQVMRLLGVIELPLNAAPNYSPLPDGPYIHIFTAFTRLRDSEHAAIDVKCGRWASSS
jgi:hypothetical protein